MNTNIFYLKDEEYYKLTAKEFSFYLSPDYDKTANVGYIIIDNYEKGRLLYCKDFEAIQITKEEVGYPLRVLLRSLEDGTMVIPNKDLILDLRLNTNIDIKNYTFLDIDSISTGDFRMDTKYIRNIEKVRNFVNKHKLKHGALLLYQNSFTIMKLQKQMDYLRNFPNVTLCFEHEWFEKLKNNQKLKKYFKSLLLDTYYPQVIHFKITGSGYESFNEPGSIIHEVIINKKYQEIAISQMEEFLSLNLTEESDS